MTDQTVPRPLPMRVSLISAPQNVLGTLLYVWLQSRHDRQVPSPEVLQCIATSDQDSFTPSSPAFKGCEMLGFDGSYNARRCASYLRDMISNLLSEGVPVTEFLTFVFEIENLPISLREQLVRHRIGVSHDPRIGADIVPHVSESAWWSTTSRAVSMENFYDEGRFIVPESLEGKRCAIPPTDTFFGYGDALEGLTDQGTWSVEALNVYRMTLQTIQSAYRYLQAAGVHIEDCRQLMPLGATHRMAWQFNMKSISHIVSKRTCWIAQLGLWKPLVTGIAEGLRSVEPVLATSLTDPPCFKAGKFAACPYDQVNSERVTGADGTTAPCPLWLHHNPEKAVAAAESVNTEEGPLWLNVTDGTDPIADHKYAHGEKIGENGFISHKPFPGDWVSRDPLAAKAMQDGRLSFEHLWHRDVDNGSPLP